MKIRSLAGICVLAQLPLTLGAQSASAGNAGDPSGPMAAALKFEAADIQVSPHINDPWFDPPHLEGDRYVIYEATMADLIAKAYGVDVATVQGGPSWLEFDRYDIQAKTLPTTSAADQKLMLQALLADRFKLVAHNGTALIPAYILKLGKDRPKIKPSDGSEDSKCDWVPQTQGSPPQIAFHCRNESMDQFAELLRNTRGGGYLNEREPVVDGTGLKGDFDFEIKWTPSNSRDRAGADAVPIFDAVDAQLGLRLAQETTPRPVLIVDSVDEKPSPDPPGTDKLLQPLPLPEFEVAVINPYKPGGPHTGSFGNGRLEAHGITLRELIILVWDLNENDKSVIVNAPPWLDKDQWDFLAKWARTDGDDQKKPPDADFRQFQEMVRDLLADRFGLKAHMENREGDAYNLVAPGPKMTPAHPNSRTRCADGPGPDGKDPRITNPVLNRLITCQNITMTQFGDMLPSLAGGYIFNTVLDNTGLKGGYNFTLSFSGAGKLLNGGSPPPSAQNQGAGASGDVDAPDPNGAVSLFDAVHRELGLKLEKVRRPVPVLVIDHIQETPTPN
jgi:uncharacterized protein (TIGR03435 family)